MFCLVLGAQRPDRPAPNCFVLVLCPMIKKLQGGPKKVSLIIFAITLSTASHFS